MLRRYLIVLAATATLLLGGALLGSLATNWFPVAGLLLSLISAVVTIIVSCRNAAAARKAAIDDIELYPPISARRIPMFFRDSMKSNRLESLEERVELLRGDHEQLADHLDDRITFALNYAQAAHERLTRHEEVDLPQILAAQSGVVVTGAILSVIGTIMVFVPDPIYRAFAQLASLACEAVVALLRLC